MNFLRNVNFIKSIREGYKEPEIDGITLISEPGLAKEWLSEEDNRWDDTF